VSICTSSFAAGSLEGRDRVVVGLLIEALDENGYFAQDLAELAELLPEELGISLDDLETALVQLQASRSAGLGAAQSGRVPGAAAQGAA